MAETCSRCGSDRIIPRTALLDSTGVPEIGKQPAEVRIVGVPQARVLKDITTGQVFLRIRGECGHAELHVSNFREPYEKYEQSGRPAD
jgi:hypothetical protein